MGVVLTWMEEDGRKGRRASCLLWLGSVLTWMKEWLFLSWHEERRPPLFITRVTIVEEGGGVVMDALVKPAKPIEDYRTEVRDWVSPPCTALHARPSRQDTGVRVCTRGRGPFPI